MKLHIDQDFMCPYFTITNGDKVRRFEIGDSIEFVTYLPSYTMEDVRPTSPEKNTTMIKHTFEKRIVNITTKMIVLDYIGHSSFVSIKDLLKHVGIEGINGL